MPELPEVETIVKGLRQNIIKDTIINVKFSCKQLRQPYPKNIIKNITNARIERVYRKAKYIMIELDNNYHIVIHLGMSGRLLVGTDLPKQKHDHAFLRLKSSKQMVLNDPRRFGLFTIMDKHQLANTKLFKKLGVEPLSSDFTTKYFYKITKKSKTPIKSIIMNAKYIVGVGNIYASESLFRSRIHPLRPGFSLSLAELKRLTSSIQTILKHAIKAGGSTLKDYVHSNGDIGYFQHYFKVYGKNKKECPTCSSIIEIIRIAGRSTFFCPKCQK